MQRKVIKIVVLGDTKVGKTAFISRYTSGFFPTGNTPKVLVDFSLKDVKWLDGFMLKVQLWEALGQECTMGNTPPPWVGGYYRNIHGCIIMFDMTRRCTFTQVVTHKRELDEHRENMSAPPVPCMLLANKCDLHRRDEISHQDIHKMSEEMGFFTWNLVSAKDNIMVESSMKMLLDEIMEQQRLQNKEVDEITRQINKIKLNSDQRTDGNNCSC